MMSLIYFYLHGKTDYILFRLVNTEVRLLDVPFIYSRTLKAPHLDVTLISIKLNKSCQRI